MSVSLSGSCAIQCATGCLSGSDNYKVPGFPVLSGAQHTTEVQFIDGSTAFTTGIVRGADWCFSASLAARDTHRLDIHVMDDLPCALILDKWMLHDNNAFTEYEDTIIDILHADAKAQGAVCMIMEKRSRDFWNKAKGKAKKLMDNSTVVEDLSQSAPLSVEAIRQEEAYTRSRAKDRIAELRVSERAAAQQAEDLRILDWNAAHVQTTLGLNGGLTGTALK